MQDEAKQGGPQVTQKPYRSQSLIVELTVQEARALYVASVTGSPEPMPPELVSARLKLYQARWAKVRAA